MGFRDNGYLTVWEVKETRSPRITRVRVSSSRKNRQTDEYETDFKGWCSFMGDCAKQALDLKQKDRIITKRVDVTNSYNKETETEYINYNVYEFEMADGSGKKSAPAKPKAVEGEPDYSMIEEDDVPF